LLKHCLLTGALCGILHTPLLHVCTVDPALQDRVYDIPYDQSQNFSTYQIPITKNYSMWHVGLHLLTAASNVYENGATWSNTKGDMTSYK
jgi:hypothetical protein